MLTDESLEFARNHITAFYDTDFFPKPFEFDALWYCWDEVKDYLLRTPLAQVHTSNPRVLPWCKARGGYRIVHQLEPLDAVIYTALVHMAALHIEAARLSSSIACSYRIEPDGNSFFARGSGFTSYRSSCEELSENFQFVLSTDVSDFYNQIYLHRVSNAIDATGAPSKLGKEIENFLSRLNNKASQGIPIGPAASIIIAEAIMIDIDQFIVNCHVDHVRYVDDIRIFSNSSDQLEEILEKLVIYLHEQHRLGLVSEKTTIRTTGEFLHEELKNQYQLEKLEILQEIEAGNPYGSYEDNEEGFYNGFSDRDGDGVDENEDSRDLGELLSDALERAKDFGYVDLAVLRAIIRRAKYARLPDLAEIILDDIDFFAPIINDICLYFDALATEDLSDLVPVFVELCSEGRFRKQSVKFWMEWLFSRRAEFSGSVQIRRFIDGGAVPFAAAFAIKNRNIAWAKDAKQKALPAASWDRRGYLSALSVLAEDERKPFLNLIKSNSALTATDRWIRKWVEDGSPDPRMLDFYDEILL